jgi:hypothetical protein
MKVQRPILAAACIGVAISLCLSLLDNLHLFGAPHSKLTLSVLFLFTGLIATLCMPGYLVANLLLGPIHNIAEGQHIQYLAAALNALIYSFIAYLILKRKRIHS